MKVMGFLDVGWSSWANVGRCLHKVVNGNGAHVVLCPGAQL